MMNGNKYNWKLYQIVLIRLAAFIFFLLGLRWLYIFLFTDYRSHQAIIMIPLGMLTILFSFGLLLLFRWCIFFLLVLMTSAFLITIYLQIVAFQIQPFLAVVSIVTVLYIILLTPQLYKLSKFRRLG